MPSCPRLSVSESPSSPRTTCGAPGWRASVCPEGTGPRGTAQVGRWRSRGSPGPSCCLWARACCPFAFALFASFHLVWDENGPLWSVATSLPQKCREVSALRIGFGPRGRTHGALMSSNKRPGPARLRSVAWPGSGTVQLESMSYVSCSMPSVTPARARWQR